MNQKMQINKPKTTSLLLVSIFLVFGQAESLARSFSNEIRYDLQYGYYADAFIKGALRDNSPNSAEMIVEQLRKRTGEASNGIFANSVEKLLLLQPLDEHLIIEYDALIKNAAKFKLLTEEQALQQAKLLELLILQQAIRKTSIAASPRIHSLFPNLLSTENINNYANEELAKINDLSFFSFSQIKHFIDFYAQGTTPPPSLLKDSILKATLQHRDFEDRNLLILFPNIKKEYISSRTFSIRIKILDSTGDISASDINQAIKQRNSNATLVHGEPVDLLIKNEKYRETREPNITSSQVVSGSNIDDSLASKIPRNASVVFDYTLTEFSIEWQVELTHIPTNKSYKVGDTTTLKRVNCTNFRYQNVFGGVGGINEFPNQATRDFCSLNAAVTAQSVRLSVVNQLANAIYDLSRSR